MSHQAHSNEVDSEAHLVVVEHAINMAADSHPSGLELLVRHFLRRRNSPALLLLNWMQTRCGQGYSPARPLNFATSTADQKLDVLGRYYGLPAFNFKAALWEVMEDFASSSAATGAGNGTVCVLPGSTYTLIAVDPLEQGESGQEHSHTDAGWDDESTA